MQEVSAGSRPVSSLARSSLSRSSTSSSSPSRTTARGGGWRTTNFGSARDDPGGFVQVLLDALTFAGLLFIVASGFSLIFRLMRVVNMAHGSFYLLAGYIAYEVQQSMTGEGFSIAGSEVNTWEWVFPMIVAAGCVALLGRRSASSSTALRAAGPSTDGISIR